ncbi:hypothetical protein Tco_0519736 [Tanacetum coccineum]
MTVQRASDLYALNLKTVLGNKCLSGTLIGLGRVRTDCLCVVWRFSVRLPSSVEVAQCKCSSTGKLLGAYNLGVATPRALVYAGLMTSGDARSCACHVALAALHDALRALLDMLLVAMLIEDMSLVMSTPAYVDSETITQADRAQSSRVAVPLPDDPYVAGDELGEEDTKEDEEDESSNGLNNEGQGLDDEGQQQAVLVVDIAASEPLGLGYGAAKSHALQSTEEIAPSKYEIGQSSKSMSEQEGAKRVSAFTQTILVTWVDPEDGKVYTDISTYVPLAAPVQIPPSPEWSLGSLPISLSSLVVPSPIASPVATLAATISVDEDPFLEKENHDLRRQLAEERRERLELADRISRMEKRHESREE